MLSAVDFFKKADGVYCSLMPRRREYIEGELDRCGVLQYVTFVESVVWYPGQYGCCETLRRILKDSQGKGHNTVLTIEDDLVINNVQGDYFSTIP